MTYKEIGDYARSVTPPALRLLVTGGFYANQCQCTWDYSDDLEMCKRGLSVIASCGGDAKHDEMTKVRIDGVIEIMMRNRPRAAFSKIKETPE